ncbi:MAG: maleylacetoacetate isomerase [Alphaproteobacteria bacterium]|nr:maleylacetoacetate isomerase [Alphaproteobacteria bacterium]
MSARTLHGYYRSSASYRVRIALNLKGLDYDQIFIHLRKGEQFTPEYTALNPQQQLPTLIEDDAAPLIQSPAILEYLEEVHPQPPLLPGDPAGRARVRAIAMAVGCDIHPLNNLRVLKYLRGELKTPEDAVRDWIHNWIRLGFEAVETLLARSSETGTFCHGANATHADIYLAPQVYNAERFDYPMERHPTIARVTASAMEHDAFARAYPDRQPDAE